MTEKKLETCSAQTRGERKGDRTLKREREERPRSSEHSTKRRWSFPAHRVSRRGRCCPRVHTQALGAGWREGAFASSALFRASETLSDSSLPDSLLQIPKLRETRRCSVCSRTHPSAPHPSIHPSACLWPQQRRWIFCVSAGSLFSSSQVNVLPSDKSGCYMMSFKRREIFWGGGYCNLWIFIWDFVRHFLVFSSAFVHVVSIAQIKNKKKHA